MAGITRTPRMHRHYSNAAQLFALISFEHGHGIQTKQQEGTIATDSILVPVLARGVLVKRELRTYLRTTYEYTTTTTTTTAIVVLLILLLYVHGYVCLLNNNQTTEYHSRVASFSDRVVELGRFLRNMHSSSLVIMEHVTLCRHTRNDMTTIGTTPVIAARRCMKLLVGPATEGVKKKNTRA